jgi:hypothetical protein
MPVFPCFCFPGRLKPDAGLNVVPLPDADVEFGIAIIPEIEEEHIEILQIEIDAFLRHLSLSNQ